jgi:hypothetical protein
MTLPMPTRGPVYASGAIHLVKGNGDRGRIEEWCGGVCPVENDAVRYRGEVCSIQSATCIGGIGPQEAEANSVLIAAAFNAAEAARQLGFDPIAAILALPKLLAACELAVNGTAGERDCSNDDECGIWPAICDALSAARTREVRP